MTVPETAFLTHLLFFFKNIKDVVSYSAREGWNQTLSTDFVSWLFMEKKKKKKNVYNFTMEYICVFF